MTDFSTDYYAILGVERTADPREIRTAFLRLVKENPPESSSETFRLVSEAYRVLSNPEKRRRYDTEERLPTDVAEQLREAGRLFKTDPQASEEALRDVCRDHPDLSAPRFTLGVLLERTGRSTDAAAVFERLFTEDPDSSVYAKWLGESLLKTGRQDLGLSYLKQAIVLDKDDHESYLCLARFFFRQHRYDDSLDALDRGVQTDGVADLSDVHLLIHKMYVLAHTGSLDEMLATADEVVGVVPLGDQEARRWVSGRLESLEQLFAKSQRSDLVDIVQRARQPLEGETRPPTGRPITVDPAREQRAALLRDPMVAAWVKKHVRLSQLPPDDPRVLSWSAEVGALFQASGPEMTAAWERARLRYPTCLAPLERHAQDEPQETEPRPTPVARRRRRRRRR